MQKKNQKLYAFFTDPETRIHAFLGLDVHRDPACTALMSPGNAP